MSGDSLIRQLAVRFGVSEEAVQTICLALECGGGRLAQFSHPDLGGYGQWMPGMTQIGDMFNRDLRSRVDRLCQELSKHIFSEQKLIPADRLETTTTSKPNPMKPMSPMKAPHLSSLRDRAMVTRPTIGRAALSAKAVSIGVQ